MTVSLPIMITQRMRADLHDLGYTDDDIANMTPAEAWQKLGGMPEPPALLDAALAYAARGWAVFPLKPREKTPVTPHGVKDASSDPATIRQWWSRMPDANLGLACGPSGLVAIDVDAAHGGFSSWEAIKKQHGLSYSTLTSWTGGGGCHLLFRAPDGVDIHNSAGRLGPGLDVRANGGYLVIPPSIHPNGKPYEWGDPNTEPAELPPSLLDLLTEPRTQPTTPPVVQVATNFNLTDIGNAERLAHFHGDKLRFCPAWGWLAYTGRYWERSTGEARRLAKETIRRIYAEAGSAPDDETCKATAKWAMRSESEGRVRAMLTLAESEPAIEARPEWFDSDPMLFNVTNGTVDLRTGELYAHRAADLITHIAGTYYDPSAQCPQWFAFLNRIFDGNLGLIGFIRRAIGYSLTGDAREQCLFFCYGVGANGKSTFLETVRALLGDYGQQTDFATFLARDNDAVRSDIARLAGVRFVSSVEAGEGRRLAETLIKQLTGGDTIAARFLYREFFEFRPSFKLWLAANHKPVIRGTDNAIWRRIRLIPFTVTIPEHEQDKGLPAKLRDELPGILAWAVAGCLQWQRDGLQPPAEVIGATALYRAEQDVLAAWLDECCVIGPTKQAASRDLIESWRAFSGDKRASMRALAERLRERGFEPARDATGARVWRGVSLQIP